MKHYHMALKKITENISNNYFTSFPCFIFKNSDIKHFDVPKYIIDKNVLGQIIYESVKSMDEGDNYIPIIISLKDNSINQMEKAGVYVLDIVNNQFIYLFGPKEERHFFDQINRIRKESKINTSLIIGYLNNSKSIISLNQRAKNILGSLLDLHGNLQGKSTMLDNSDEIKLPLLNDFCKLDLLYWIEKSGFIYDK